MAHGSDDHNNIFDGDQNLHGYAWKGLDQGGHSDSSDLVQETLTFLGLLLM